MCCFTFRFSFCLSFLFFILLTFLLLLLCGVFLNLCSLLPLLGIRVASVRLVLPSFILTRGPQFVCHLSNRLFGLVICDFLCQVFTGGFYSCFLYICSFWYSSFRTFSFLSFPLLTTYSAHRQLIDFSNSCCISWFIFSFSVYKFPRKGGMNQCTFAKVYSIFLCIGSLEVCSFLWDTLVSLLCFGCQQVSSWVTFLTCSASRIFLISFIFRYFRFLHSVFSCFSIYTCILLSFIWSGSFTYVVSSTALMSFYSL